MEKEHALTAWRNSQTPVITQEVLGAALGISRWWVNRLETGERTPSIDLALKIDGLTGGEVTWKDFAVGSKKKEVAA